MIEPEWKSPEINKIKTESELIELTQDKNISSVLIQSYILKKIFLRCVILVM